MNYFLIINYIIIQITTFTIQILSPIIYLFILINILAITLESTFIPHFTNATAKLTTISLVI